MTFTDNVKANDPVGSKKDYLKCPHIWTKNDQNWPKANVTHNSYHSDRKANIYWVYYTCQKNEMIYFLSTLVAGLCPVHGQFSPRKSWVFMLLMSP